MYWDLGWVIGPVAMPGAENWENKRRNIFWQGEVLRGYSSGVEVYRRKLELQKEVTPIITIQRAIVGGMNVDKSLPRARRWSEKRASPPVSVTSKEERKEEPGRAWKESREVGEAQERVQLKPRGKEESHSGKVSWEEAVEDDQSPGNFRKQLWEGEERKLGSQENNKARQRDWVTLREQEGWGQAWLHFAVFQCPREYNLNIRPIACHHEVEKHARLVFQCVLSSCLT